MGEFSCKIPRCPRGFSHPFRDREMSEGLWRDSSERESLEDEWNSNAHVLCLNYSSYGQIPLGFKTSPFYFSPFTLIALYDAL